MKKKGRIGREGARALSENARNESSTHAAGVRLRRFVHRPSVAGRRQRKPADSGAPPARSSKAGCEAAREKFVESTELRWGSRRGGETGVPALEKAAGIVIAFQGPLGWT